ncbi:MAG TPA: hypothetical protein VNE39_08365 [Planctomycetota bacterium]|nr:hypothetical protein [Planctomycetota bacterium]
MKLWKPGTTLAAILVAVVGLAAEHQAHGHEPGKENAEETPAKSGKPQTACPVMGGKINGTFFADHEGKRVYFCCEGCIAQFKKDPAKYIKKLEGEGVTLAKLQTNCPVMGGKIDPKLFADHAGKRVYFCCPGCKAPFLKDPEKYIKKLEDEGVATEAPPATKESHEHKGHH